MHASKKQSSTKSVEFINAFLDDVINSGKIIFQFISVFYTINFFTGIS